jgi:TPR repeat protein
MRSFLTVLLILVCANGAAAQTDMETVERDPRIDGFLERCDAGEHYACNYAIALFKRADPTFWLGSENIVLNLRSCSLGSERACWKFEFIGIPNPYRPVRQDTQRYLPVAREGCSHGSTMACWQVATILREQNLLDAAIEHAALSCDGGFSDGCVLQSELLVQVGGDALPAAALACYGRGAGRLRTQPQCQLSCDLDDARACRALAQMFYAGRDGARFVTRDPDRARNLYERACRLGDTESCAP